MPSTGLPLCEHTNMVENSNELLCGKAIPCWLLFRLSEVTPLAPAKCLPALVSNRERTGLGPQ